MKAAFFGTSKYCLPVLESLSSNFDLRLVVTQPDKHVGRKQVLTPPPVKVWALEHNIATITPATLKKDTPDRLTLFKLLNSLNLDLAFVSDYGLIIPEAVFNVPRLGSFNIHYSKLPDLRGPSPVQSTILRGDKTAWVTIFKLDNNPKLEIKMDAGPILWQREYEVSDNDTTETLYTRLFEEVSMELPNIVKSLATGHLSLLGQDHTKATYTRLLAKDDGFVKWETLEKAIKGERLEIADLPKILQSSINSLPLHSTSYVLHLHNLYRALNPWPGLWSIHSNGKRIKILKCHLEGEKLILDEVQFEGKKPQKYSTV